jgi:hypothetical protein
MSSLQRVASVVAVVTLVSAVGAFSAAAEPYYQGPGKCGDCHKPEVAVFNKTLHATSFREIHRHKATKPILQAAGGNTNIRRNDVCTHCHFTMTKANASAQPTATVGPSCESCHGPSSDWMPIHNAKGPRGPRIEKAAQAGMVHPDHLYDIAQNCLSCHGAARPGVDPGTLAKMFDAGHPVGAAFELVQYSQGSVRHRFYPPDESKNKEMTPAELARMFITGHAAALVMQASVAGKVNNAKYNEALKKIETAARTALDAIKGQVPEAAALLAQPTDANARKLVAAISNKDLSGQVGRLLPAKNTYK